MAAQAFGVPGTAEGLGVAPGLASLCPPGAPTSPTTLQPALQAPV